MSRKKKQTFNLAERAQVMELMKQLYGDVTDDTLNSTARKTGTTVAGGVAELPSSTKETFLQDKQRS